MQIYKDSYYINEMSASCCGFYAGMMIFLAK